MKAASKTSPIQFGQNPVPIDIAGTWSQMLIPLAVIVLCVRSEFLGRIYLLEQNLERQHRNCLRGTIERSEAGTIVEPNGKVSINNPQTKSALAMAKGR
jgi:hypothetical protein